MNPVRYALTIALLTLAPTAASQSFWLDTGRDASLALEVLKPSFDAEMLGPETKVSFLTSATFLSARAPLSPRVRIAFDLPIAHYRFRASYQGHAFDESDTAIGNPYLGLEHTARSVPLMTEIGVRLPLAPKTNGAVGVGALTDFDRLEAFMPENATISLAANYFHENADGLRFRARVGPSVALYTGRRVEYAGRHYPDAAELFLNYAAKVWYRTPQAELGTGLSGRTWVSEASSLTEDRFWHHFGLWASAHLGRVSPGVHFRLPLNQDVQEVVNFVVGVNAVVQF
jgi:hypothetical protein